MIKRVLVIVPLLAFFLVLLAGLSFIRLEGGRETIRRPISPPPLPTPTISLKEMTASPSAWATDAAVLEIENSLEGLKKDLETVDLNEETLLPPVLDLNVEF